MRTFEEMTSGKKPLDAVSVLLGDSLATRAERIRAMAFCLQVGQDLQDSDINPLLETIQELADEIVMHSDFATDLLKAVRA